MPNLFRNLALPLDKSTTREMKILIKMMEEEGPFSAYGLFVVDRSILTAMLSTCVTYLIILYQQNDAETSKVE